MIYRTITIGVAWEMWEPDFDEQVVDDLILVAEQHPFVHQVESVSYGPMDEP